MGRKKFSFTMRFVLIFGAILLAANITLGMLILKQSESAMKSLIAKNMLDIVTSAAGSLDGDVLGALTEDDVDGPAFNEIAKRLTVFQKTVEIHFIYAVRQTGEDTFVFTVDPDPVDPGAFGEEIVVTDAVRKAGRGIAAVDDAPAEDRWGNFYSAYSPVLDSNGDVAGIVGIDYDSDWYNEQMRHNTLTITLETALSFGIGVVLLFLITNGVRRRFRKVNEGLSRLSDSVDQLMRQMGDLSGGAMEHDADLSHDELEALDQRVQSIQADMTVYLKFLQRQAYTDSLTQVGSSAAYHELMKKTEEEITQGVADFSVVVFDVNSLKMINDKMGHECGDKTIQGAAQVISKVFGAENTFRIGGDEFAVVKQSAEVKDLERVDAEIADFNRQHSNGCMRLSVSKGLAHYHAEQDKSFKEVFSRADKYMYEEKRRYYENEGNRRGKR